MFNIGEVEAHRNDIPGLYLDWNDALGLKWGQNIMATNRKETFRMIVSVYISIDLDIVGIVVQPMKNHNGFRWWLGVE